MTDFYAAALANLLKALDVAPDQPGLHKPELLRALIDQLTAARAERDELREMNRIYRENNPKGYAAANRERERAEKAEAEIAATATILTNIVTNARMIPDPKMGEMTDIYTVPIDDIDAAATALAALEQKDKTR